MAKRDHAKGSIPYRFVPLPVEVIQSAEWQTLPPNAVKLIIDLMGQYTGKNNGRLCPAFAAMEKSGWKSKETLATAKRALLKCGFVVQTRVGHPPRTSEWIAFTWWKLDYEKSMDIEPRHFPYLNFASTSIAASTPGMREKNKSCVTKIVPIEPKNGSRSPDYRTDRQEYQGLSVQ